MHGGIAVFVRNLITCVSRDTVRVMACGVCVCGWVSLFCSCLSHIEICISVRLGLGLRAIHTETYNYNGGKNRCQVSL